MKCQAWPGGNCRAHACSSQWGWLRTRWGWQLPWVPGCLSPPRPSFMTPGAADWRALNTSDHLCWHQPSWASRLHRSKLCTYACVSYKIRSPISVSLRLAQAPNSFCTDKHHTFVSPVVCQLQGGISREEQGRAAKIITSFGSRVTNLSSVRGNRHHPAAVCL